MTDIKIREFTLAEGTTVPDRAHAAMEALSAEAGLTARLLAAAGGKYVIQAHSRNERILRWLGLDQHLTVTLAPAGPRQVLVEIAGGRRFSRSAVFATGVLIACWPLSLTAPAGFIREKLLVRRILRTLRSHAPPWGPPVVYCR